MKKCLLFLLLLPFNVWAQSDAIHKIRQYQQLQELNLLQDFRSFLSIPNIASDQENILRNANWIMAYMKTKGIGNVRLLSPKTSGFPPAVFGQVLVPGAKETIILYAHYDGQPVDSTKWEKGLHPFKPVMTNGALTQGAKIGEWPDIVPVDPMWRIYGRGAS